MEEAYKNKDFTDYLLLFLNTGKIDQFEKAFKTLVDESKLIEDLYPELFETEHTVKKEYEEYQEIDFYEAIKEKYINTPISFKAIVRGEAEKPYIYPTKVNVSCDITRGDMCRTCGLFLTGGNLEVGLDNFNPLELIDITEESKI